MIAVFSKAKVTANLGVTLIQMMRTSAFCLNETLGTQDDKPNTITWLAPAGRSLADAQLPPEIKSPGDQAAECQPLSAAVL